MSEGRNTKVLYVVGNNAPTSVALEVVQYIDKKDVQIRVASFYETEHQASELPTGITRVDAVSRFDLLGAWKLFQIVLEYQPDVIHIHHTVSAFWAALFGKLMGAKIVRSEHSNSQFHTTVQRAVNTVTRLLSDQVLCNSRNTYQGLPVWQRRVLANRCKVVNNGVNASRIVRATSNDPPFSAAEKREVVTVGSVGRLIPQKNYEAFLQAFARVVDEFEGEVRLVLVGDGKERSVIEDEIYRLGLDGRVILTGEVKREQVYAALHAFDIFVMPSLSEGFCNSAVEAMAAELPLLCSDIPTLREVTGDVAVYADPNDPSSMSQSLVELLKEGEKGWEKRGRQARELAVEQYSVQRTAQKYVDHYLGV